MSYGPNFPDLFRRAFEDSVASAVVLHFDRLGGGGVTCKFEKQPHAKRPPVVDDQVLLSDALCKSFHGAN